MYLSSYTRSRRPVTLVYAASFPTKEEAMREEWRIKQLRRGEKLALIRAAAPDMKDGMPVSILPGNETRPPEQDLKE